MLNSRLSNKLRLSTLVLLVFILLGSLLAYLRMRQVSRLSEAVAEARIPALSAVRDLHVAELGELSALQSYVLFGADPSMARRYGAEVQEYRSKAQAALGDIARLRSIYDALVGVGTVENLLHHHRAFEETEGQVQELAVGHGSDGTGKAFDLLQGPAAKANAEFLSSVTEVVGKLVAATSLDLNSVVEINRHEAMHLWLFIFLGGLFGVGMAEITMRRVVGSILRVAERAQTIAEGDLTGEPMHMDSNDEVTA